MTDRRKHIALDFLRLAQEDLVRASTLVTARIQLAYDYGATDHDIMHTLGGVSENSEHQAGVLAVR